MKLLIPLAMALLVAASPAAALDVSPATERATQLIEAGKTNEGMAVLTGAAAQNDVSALVFLAFIYIEANQLDRALSQAEAALRLAPKDADAHFTRGKVFAALGREDEALADFDQVLVKEPRAQAYFERGAILSERREYEKALADFRLAFQTDPTMTDALWGSAHALESLERPSEALANWDLMIRLNAGRPDVLQRRGDLLMSMGRLEEATSDYEGAVKAEPKNAALQISLGAAWEARGDNRRALAAYSAATRIDPRNVYGWWNTGLILKLQGRAKPALAAFDRAVALDPLNAELLTDRALARYFADDDRALADFDAALKLDPNLVYALEWRGAYFIGLNQPAKALADLDLATKVAPTDSLALQFRAQALMMLNRHDRALADINRSIAAQKTAMNVTMRGEIYGAMGDHLQAVEAFDEAIALDPAYADAWMGRSKSKAEMGDKAAAESDRARALKLDPSLAD